MDKLKQDSVDSGDESEENSEQRSRPKNTNLAEVKKPPREPWGRLLFVFANYCIIGMDFMVYPVIYVELVRYFDIPTAQIGWPASIHQATMFLFGIFVSAPMKIYGCRVMAIAGGVVSATGTSLSFLADSIPVICLTFGFLAGAGVSMIQMSNMVTLQKSFTKHRPIATSIGMCGLSLGNVIGPAYTRYLILLYGWRGAFLLHAGLMLQATVIGTQYKDLVTTRLEKSKTLTALLKDTFDFSLLKNPTFTLYGISVFLLRTMHHGPVTVLANSVVFYGGSKQQAMLILTALSTAMLAGRLCNGVLANMNCVNRTILLGVSIFVSGITLTVFSAAVHVYQAAIFVIIVYAWNTGCTIMLIFVVLVDIIGVDNIARSAALIFVFQGLGALNSPPLAGFMFDVTGNYTLTFLVSGSIGILGGSLFLPIYLNVRKGRQETAAVADRRDVEET